MLTWFFLLLFLAIAVSAAGLAARSYLTGEPLLGNFLQPKPDKRLSVIEQTSVDSRRKLILVRRDGVEHLIMTGGPVDVVIETGIGAPAPSVAATGASVRSTARVVDSDVPATAPVFGRAPRNLGQVVNE